MPRFKFKPSCDFSNPLRLAEPQFPHLLNGNHETPLLQGVSYNVKAYLMPGTKNTYEALLVITCLAEKFISTMTICLFVL